MTLIDLRRIGKVAGLFGCTGLSGAAYHDDCAAEQ